MAQTSGCLRSHCHAYAFLHAFMYATCGEECGGGLLDVERVTNRFGDAVVGPWVLGPQHLAVCAHVCVRTRLPTSESESFRSLEETAISHHVVRRFLFTCLFFLRRFESRAPIRILPTDVFFLSHKDTLQEHPIYITLKTTSGNKPPFFFCAYYFAKAARLKACSKGGQKRTDVGAMRARLARWWHATTLPSGIDKTACSTCVANIEIDCHY